MAQVSDKAVLFRLVEELDINFGMQDFDSRLRLQKAVYLLKSVGARLDYSYNWYLRGPYSPALAQTLFEIEQHKSAVAKEAASISIGAKANDHLRTLSTVLKNKPSTVTTLTRWYELLASAAYLKRAGKSDERIRQQLKDEKDYSDAAVDDAFTAMGTLGIKA